MRITGDKPSAPFTSFLAEGMRVRFRDFAPEHLAGCPPFHAATAVGPTLVVALKIDVGSLCIS